MDESAVRRSVERGLKQLRWMLTGADISSDDLARRSHTQCVKHFHPKKERPDRQSDHPSLINIYGAPEKSKTFWGKEAQRNEQEMTSQSHSEENEVCADAGGVADGE
ncbi:MAG: hypothetical protein KIC46_04705 [Clostridiales bacterium]|nr:hypothetical protein [Clostridiales bacterium]